MKYSYTLEEIRRADAAAIEGGTAPSELMERAASALAEAAAKVMKEHGFSDALFVCGGGNNGGDGFAAARILSEGGADVSVLCLAKKFSRECAEMAKRYRGELFARIPRRRYALIVDCLLGTGISRAPEGDAEVLIDYINGSGAFVLACDLPSGLTENGIAPGKCVNADLTLTFGGMKNALRMADGADVCGKVTTAEIGLTLPRGTEVWEDGDVLAFFPKRKSHVNKGTFGSALIFAGGAVSSGAAFLAAEACLKSGAGYTRLSVVEPYFSRAIGKLPPVILREFHAIDGEMLSSDCIAMGMGSGVSERIYALIVELLPKYTGTLVLDADALNALGVYGAEVLIEKACRVIVTPHPKEFARLSGRSVPEVLAHAKELAEEFARKYSVTVLLKNNRSLVTDGERTALIVTGSPALSKGGSGDALTGFLAGTCARGVPPFEAACVSSYLLGRAGEIAAEEMGEYAPDATDVIGLFPKAMLSLARGTRTDGP